MRVSRRAIPVRPSLCHPHRFVLNQLPLIVCRDAVSLRVRSPKACDRAKARAYYAAHRETVLARVNARNAARRDEAMQGPAGAGRRQS